MAVRCPKCQTENAETALFCSGCGTKLEAAGEFSLFQTETLENSLKELSMGSTFANRYQVIEELGKGGMGKVYKVLDTHINEKIALKLLKPEITADKKTIERFSNELKFARKISHRNVCRMYDLGREAGNFFITMEYVSGEDLKSFIRRSRQLVVGTAILIAKEVCDGLAEAHRVGVVHRDLKPGNIMIDKEGNAKIMDFGIARSISVKGITGAGVMIGTPEYMSPEQVEGKEVDARSDIYSLGIILYEMLTGQVPFEGDTPFTIGVKQKSEIPKDPKSLNSQIPQDLSRLILKCLEKDKERRCQNADELKADLEKIEKGIPTIERPLPKRKTATSREITVKFRLKKLFWPAFSIVVLMILSVVLWRAFVTKKASLAPEKPPARIAGLPGSKNSIAVLPFQNISPEEGQDYFCDGLTDELITRLSNIKELKVIAKTSAYSFKGKEIDIREIGNKLNVATVLEGGVRKAGNKLRITAQLINVSDGSHLWSDSWDRDLTDVFAIQDEIALMIVNKLKLTLLGEEKSKLTRRPTEHLEAYNLYLQGRFLIDKGTPYLGQARDYFSQAIKLDPNYGLAYAGLAEVYTWLCLAGTSSNELMPRANEAAHKASKIDDKLAEAHLALADIKFFYNWDWAGAEAEYLNAIELNPNYARAYSEYSTYLMVLKRYDEALEKAKKGEELDPLSPMRLSYLGDTLRHMRRDDEAIEVLNKAIEMDPNNDNLHWTLWLIYIYKGMYKDAQREMEKLMEIGGFPGWHASPEEMEDFKIISKERGWRGGLGWNLDRMMEKAKKEYVAPMLIAQCHVILGHKDEAIKWLERAHSERDLLMPYLNTDPTFDPIRNDAHFIEILKKMGFPK
jgi:serine/threonine protein kinase/Tfp pilus assembly protein PilF